MKTIGLIAVLTILAGSSASAEGFRVRARERFQTGHYNAGDGNGRFAFNGFASAVDLWYEKPFDWSAGLTVQRGGLNRNAGDGRANTTTLGLEAKVFPVKDLRVPLFVRAGILVEAFDRSGSDPARWSPGIATSAGAEFLVKRIGIAPEFGLRSFWGPSGRYHTSATFAIGVHFYQIGGL